MTSHDAVLCLKQLHLTLFYKISESSSILTYVVYVKYFNFITVYFK